ncbi:MAG: hypothetical protein IKB40_07205 [Paludibacteraceae bacterium]|nr:hypothetical protein [Paludibacteraceae bacterium]
MQKITIYFALLLLWVSAGVSAQQPESLQVHKTSGTTQSVSLVSIQHITFEVDVLVLTTSEGTFRLPLNDVEYIAFGEDGSVSTAVENIESTATRLFKNGNQLTVECESAINRLYLVDMTGKVLVNQQCSMTNETTVMLPQSSVFVLFLETTQGYVAHKIVNN